MPGPGIYGAEQRVVPAGPAGRSAWKRFGFALGCVALAALLRGSLNPLFEKSFPWIFFYPAVLLAAWYGGLVPGFIATALSAVLAAFLWMEPASSALRFGASVAAFTLSCAVMCLLAEVWNRTAASQQQARLDLEYERTFLDSVLSSITDGFSVYDREWRCVYINDSALRITRKSRDEMLGKVVWDVFPHLVGGQVHSELLASRRENKAARFDVAYPEAAVWLEFRAYPMSGSTAVYIADISARKQAELKLAEAQEELARHASRLEEVVHERTARLEETIAELERFSYTVSHDLRAPLRAMHSFASFVVEDYGERLDSTGREYLQRIQDAAERMDALIRDLLLYSRISRTELALSPVDLDDLVQKTVQEYAPQSTGHIAISRPLGQVVGNRTLLSQAVANLLVNALKFVPPGENPNVSIWTEAHRDRITFFIRDSGIGIPKAAQEKVFGMFQRAHSAEYEGTGVGLAIVKRAVERMNGRVGFESEPGQGSTFWIELPARPAEPPGSAS